MSAVRSAVIIVRGADHHDSFGCCRRYSGRLNNRLTKPAGSRPSRAKLKALWLSFALLVASGIFVLATPTAAQAATFRPAFQSRWFSVD